MIHSFLNGIDDGLEYSRQTLLIFTNIKYITVSDEFNVLTGYTVVSYAVCYNACIVQCIKCLHARYTHSRSLSRSICVC